MPTIAIKEGQRQRISSAPVETITPYWTRVLSMGRGRYHRNTAPFSDSARKNAADLKLIALQVATAQGLHVDALWYDTECMSHLAKFQHYILSEPNAFAAKACLKNAERRASYIY